MEDASTRGGNFLIAKKNNPWAKARNEHASIMLPLKTSWVIAVSFPVSHSEIQCGQVGLKTNTAEKHA